MKLGSYIKIQQKLRGFIRKYFINEFIKGSLLFIAIGCVYFLLILFVENFFWLSPTYRTWLFGLFILVEGLLFVKFILIPVIKLIGLRKGISDHQAAEIIGAFFPEVSDKLVNVLELSANPNKSDLLLAGIEQKSSELQPIPFRKAIDFKGNKKYLKYVAIPFVIMAGIYITGQIQDFNSSLKRVVDYKTLYEPPAPFQFFVMNESMRVLENEDFHLNVETMGDVIPSDVKLVVNEEVFYLSKLQEGTFEFHFEKLRESTSFYLEANGVKSSQKTIEVIKTPSIDNIQISLNFPKYVNKPNEVIRNTGNLVIPEGTSVNWIVNTRNTKAIEIQFDQEEAELFNENEENFTFEKKIKKDSRYEISSSNEYVADFGALKFEILTIKDQFPSLVVNVLQDSIFQGDLTFFGQVGDDYGISDFKFVYYDVNEVKNLKINKLEVRNYSLSEFYLNFPGDFELKEGSFYECYFEVVDNDAVNGRKSIKSAVYKLYKPTEKEYKDALLDKQKNNLDEIDSALKEAEEVDKGLEELQNELQRNAELDWNEFQRLEEYLERQEHYEEMFEQQTEELQNNLEKTDVNESTKRKKEALLERIEETKKSLREERLMKELKELADKLDREKLAEELQKMSQKNKRDQKNLERILELTKRFYVEQKLDQLKENLKDRAEELDSIMSMDDLELERNDQKEFNEKVKEEQEKLDELQLENSKLKSPMEVPIDNYDMEKLNEMLEDALDKLNKGDQEGAEKSQKKAKNKMQRMSQTMESSMMNMQGEMLNENIDDLRIIVENLITFSYLQEGVFEEFRVMESGAPDFAQNLKKQNNLKQFFEHIDDSIYSLSLRMLNMQMGIQNEISEVEFNMDRALSNLGDNRFEQGVSHQQFVLTSSNNLANMLSDILDAMMNASMKMGSGEGDGQEFSLPDIIKKQEQLMQQMQQGQKGKENKDGQEGEEGSNKEGDNGENGESSGDGLSDDELFQIYKEQNSLKEALKSLQEGQQKGPGKGNGDSDKALSEMDELEDLLLNKASLEEVMRKMTELKHELLKLDEAKKEQGEQKERESETNFDDYKPSNLRLERLPDELKNYNEILIRQSLPLRSIYKKLVQDYFKEKEE